MVKLSKPMRGALYLAPDAISAITDAGQSQMWHGVRANVQTFDGKWHEVGETPDEVARLIAEARRP